MFLRDCLNIIVLVFFLSICVQNAEAQETYNAASTAAESQLDALLKFADADTDMSDFVLNIPKRQSTKDQQFASYFTSSFLARMSYKERQLVQRDCGGHYIEGELCGIDYNPITCAQDNLGTYFYHTEKENPYNATISFSYDRERNFAVYTLVKTHTGWKLNNVECAFP